MRFLFLLFVLLPLTEIVILIQVGQLIGAWYTVGLVLLSAFIGVNMLRHQGLSTLMRARQRMDHGQLPAQEIAEGLVLAVGGALLVTPGLVTDAIGFSCLIPAVRRRIVVEMRKRSTLVVNGQMAGGPIPNSDPDLGPFSHSGRSTRPGSGDVIDGEYRREE
ncbi:MAG TPA: FxsA family protein [Motiliproteus sp.]